MPQLFTCCEFSGRFWGKICSYYRFWHWDDHTKLDQELFLDECDGLRERSIVLTMGMRMLL